MDIAIMVEGQNGLNWARWQRIARAVEDLGFAGLYRSDHFTNGAPPDLDSLELWVSLTWLASHTRRIEFGPLVTPLSYRHPVLTARMAAGVDDLSGGRLTLGVGAGWQEREHASFGFELPPVKVRLARLHEGLEVITRLLRSHEPVSYTGQYFKLQAAQLLPHPAGANRPPILIGGGKAVLPYVARYGDEWNVAFETPEGFAKLNQQLDRLIAEQKRDPAGVRRSLMTGLLFARDDADLQHRLAARHESLADLQARGLVAGVAGQIVDRLGAYAGAGVQRVMLQWLNLDDMDGLEAFAKVVLQVK